jgi:hypothetical protein
VIEKYESEQAFSEHFDGVALADLLSALDGKLSKDLDMQVLVRAAGAWLWGSFRPAASLRATASPRSRVSFMITFGFASTR